MVTRCPHCGATVIVDEYFSGTYINCSTCTFPFQFTKPFAHAQNVPAQGMTKTEIDAITNTSPQHYKKAIQPIDYITANNLDFHHGNVIKYVSMWREKEGIKDLEKALDYLQRIITLAKEGHYGQAHKSKD